MNKIYLILAIMLLTITGINASLGTFKQYECVNIKTILNSSYVNISSLSYPNSSFILTNLAMTKSGYSFNYSFCNTSVIGSYTYDYFDDTGNVYVNDFIITSTGNQSSIQGIIFYLISLGIICLFFAVCVMFFFKFDNLLNRVAMIGLCYLLIIAISFISWQMSNDFLSNTAFITKFMYIIFIVLMAGALPLFIGSFAWYVLMILRIKEIDGLIEHGYSLDEAHERVNKSGRRK